MQQETSRQSLSTMFPKKADLPPFDAANALTLHQVVAGDDAIDIQIHQLPFVYDESKQDRIQFAFSPYSHGNVIIFSPTSEMRDMSSLIIFNLAQKMKRFAIYNMQLDRFVLDFTQLEIFEENFVKEALCFRDQKNATIVADSVKNFLRVEYHCKCNTPGGENRETNYFDFWDGTKQSIECSAPDCKERYHIECISNDTSANPSLMDWKCPKSSLEELVDHGKYWGTNLITNTCTVDGHMSGLILNYLL